MSKMLHLGTLAWWGGWNIVVSSIRDLQRRKKRPCRTGPKPLFLDNFDPWYLGHCWPPRKNICGVTPGFGPVRHGRFLRLWKSLIEETKIFQPPHQARVPKCSILLIVYARNPYIMAKLGFLQRQWAVSMCIERYLGRQGGVCVVKFCHIYPFLRPAPAQCSHKGSFWWEKHGILVMFYSKKWFFLPKKRILLTISKVFIN